MGQLRPGDDAPPFSLTDDSGQSVSSESLRGTRYVLYFYPRDSLVSLGQARVLGRLEAARDRLLETTSASF